MNALQINRATDCEKCILIDFNVIQTLEIPLP